MKQTVKITLCGIMAALSAVFMILSFFPYLTYAVPAISGLFMMVPVIEIDRKWAFLTFLAAAVPVSLFAEPESKLMYLCFLGYYPILKSLIDPIGRPVLEWLLKLLCFNAAVIAAYRLLAGAFGVSLDDLDTFGQYGEVVLLLLGNVAFVLYDIAVSRMAALYMARLHKKIVKIIRRVGDLSV